MAHELDMTTGKVAMAYIGETPWHGLGQELESNASIETWKEQAGMNWEIQSAPAQFQISPEEFGTYEGKTILYRSDTKAPLSVVSDKYKVVQPQEVLEFFRDLVEDLGMKLSTAGCLFDGRKFWALADTGMAGKVLGNDEIKGNLLLTSSCDGTSPTIAQFTSIRVVCNNTLQISLSENGKTKAKVRHRQVFVPMDIKKQLGLFHDSWDGFMKSITTLSNQASTDKAAMEFYKKLMAKDEEQLKEYPRNLEKSVEALMDLYKNGKGADMAYGTKWGVLNAVTEYVDWYSGGRTDDTRLWNAWQGKNAELKNEAYDSLMETV